MPVKKKGKGSKLARMSEEERARYLQHRADLELEAKRRKQQLIAVFTKNKLKREEAFSRLNTAKINEQWRFILRQIKCKELHQDALRLSQNFEKSIETKGRIIKKLYSELEAADEDHRSLQEAHMIRIDALIGHQKRRLARLWNFYSSELNDILSTDVVELKKLRDELEKSVNDLRLIILKKQKSTDEKFSEIQTRNAVRLHSILYLSGDATSELVRDASVRMENLWISLNNVITNYEETTDRKRKQYEYLRDQDDSHRAFVSRCPAVQAQLENVIETIRADIRSLTETRTDRIDRLRSEESERKGRIEEIRREFILCQFKDSERLKKLSVASNEALKMLEKLSDKGSQLLQFIKTCANLEPALIRLKKYSLARKELADFRLSGPSHPFDKLENFWDRFNRIEADNVCLRQEADELALESQKLRHTLQTYLATISSSSIRSRQLPMISV